MDQIRDSIEVDVPVQTAYHQWTQFEEFPRFMEGIDRVVQLDDQTLEWTATIAGRTKQWQARIVEQVPDQRIAWVAVDGARNDGIVTFQPLSAGRTRIDVAMDVEPDGATESLGTALGVVKARVHGDLERFRDVVEGRDGADGTTRHRMPEEATGRGFAEGQADPELTRRPVQGLGGGSAADEEATGRGFAEGQADPELTRREPSGTVDRIASNPSR